MAWKFYVYALTDGDEVAYVGKGFGYRLSRQRRTYGLNGHEIARFRLERSAFAFEKQLIAELKPRLNKTPGGDGGKIGPRVWKGWTPETLLASRIDCADFLLSKDLASVGWEQSRIENLRRARQELMDGIRT